MRNLYSFFAVALFFIMLLAPLGASKGEIMLPPVGDGEAEFTAEDGFKIKTEAGVVTLSAVDYICGVVAAEMPALYEPEALKAQTVAAYTYAYKKREAAAENEYHLTDSPLTDQCYQDEAARREKWGEKFDEYESKIKAAVSEVCGQLITFGGEPIFAAYHAMSSGKTESAVNVWGGEVPYLCGVDSAADMQAENYKTEVVFTPDELMQRLSLEGLPQNITEWVIESEKSEAGTVLRFSLCGNEFKGSDVREKLSLRSSNFDVNYTDGGYLFTVYGSGHGVGMSQNGANAMAKEGKTYSEILLWYYPGCEIK